MTWHMPQWKPWDVTSDTFCLEMNMIPKVNWEAPEVTDFGILVLDTALHLELFLIGAAMMSLFCTKDLYSEDIITGNCDCCLPWNCNDIMGIMFRWDFCLMTLAFIEICNVKYCAEMWMALGTYLDFALQAGLLKQRDCSSVCFYSFTLYGLLRPFALGLDHSGSACHSSVLQQLSVYFKITRQHHKCDLLVLIASWKKPLK